MTWRGTTPSTWDTMTPPLAQNVLFLVQHALHTPTYPHTHTRTKTLTYVLCFPSIARPTGDFFLLDLLHCCIRGGWCTGGPCSTAFIGLITPSSCVDMYTKRTCREHMHTAYSMHMQNLDTLWWCKDNMVQPVPTYITAYLLLPVCVCAFLACALLCPPWGDGAPWALCHLPQQHLPSLPFWGVELHQKVWALWMLELAHGCRAVDDGQTCRLVMMCAPCQHMCSLKRTSNICCRLLYLVYINGVPEPLSSGSYLPTNGDCFRPPCRAAAISNARDYEYYAAIRLCSGDNCSH